MRAPDFTPATLDRPDRPLAAEPPGAAASARACRARAAALDDRALIVAMRADDVHAWAEFDARFRPPLVALARRVPLSAGLTDAEVADALVDDLLAEEAARLTAPDAPVVPVLATYLLRAARHRLYNLRRDTSRRLRRHADASDADGEGPLCSEYALRISAGPAVVRETPNEDATPVLRLAAALRAATTTEEQLLLAWVAQRVPHRRIAEWLNVGYDAATKRVWRLCRRLRAVAVRHAAALAPAERREVERFLRRAGALPPLLAAVPADAPRRAVHGGDAHPVDDHA